ncbi:nucleoid DNA-binding protein [Pedobacter sp. UYEF25]
MDILINLLEHLRQTNEVGIAGLGTFYKKKYPGSFDKEKKSFSPPKNMLHFTADVKGANTFETFISEKEHVSRESAQDYISQFVEELTQKLKLDHEATLQNIGRLFYTAQLDLSFEASEKFDYGAEFYGLPIIPETKIIEKDILATSENKEHSSIAGIVADTPSAANEPTETVESSNPFPVIENIELDEVRTDLENTLAHLETHKINSEQEEPIKDKQDQSAESSTTTPTDIETTEVNERDINLADRHFNTPIVEPRLTEKEFETILPNQETEKEREDTSTPTVLSVLESNLKKETSEKQVTDAPEFIKEQHEEHPEKFGTDPMEHPTEKSIWPKVFVTFIILLILGGLAYFFQPNLFNRSADPIAKVVAPIDSTKVKITSIDTAKGKQDSIKKADSVLKVNMVQSPVRDSIKGQNIANNTPIFTFDVIVASYKTEKAALSYISMMKKNGYNAKIANMTGTRKKISIASFPSEQEAKKQLIILQKKLKGKGFYVQKIKTL